MQRKGCACASKYSAECEKEKFQRINQQILTKTNPDEKGLFGYLTKIECQPKNIFFYVRSENKTLRFGSVSFETVSLVALTQEMFGKPIACGDRFNNQPVVVLYNSKSNEVRAVEFVPAKFVLSN